ncbi:RING finger protein 166 [Anabarilius grahami]|uniref:RING finger protein 166 n=1 Tax=Anabarilius grahami TaxID=495550 RepID=A0A3N0XTI5_ANAGA|nr:RING finger protein 166 [Anabarilius grahami]
MMAMFRSFVSAAQLRQHQQQNGAAAAAPGESLESQFSCPICLEVYHKPVSIASCAHTLTSTGWLFLLGGCSSRLINKLQLVQNAAARVLTRTRNYDHISPVLSSLHWLPVKHRIDFKILLITYKALNGLAPQYLSELLMHYSPSRLLRSQNSGQLIIPRISKSTAGGRSFSYLAPKLWNNLPSIVRDADTLCQFKSRLKTYLFNLAYT